MPTLFVGSPLPPWFHPSLTLLVDSTGQKGQNFGPASCVSVLFFRFPVFSSLAFLTVVLFVAAEAKEEARGGKGESGGKRGRKEEDKRGLVLCVLVQSASGELYVDRCNWREGVSGKFCCAYAVRQAASPHNRHFFCEKIPSKFPRQAVSQIWDLQL